MARFKTVLRHSSYLFASKMFTRFLFTLFVIFAATKLGPELFGALSFSLAMVELLSWFGDLGLTRYGARELVGEGGNERAVINGQILILQVFSSVVLCALGLVAVLAWNPGYPKTELLLMGLVAVLLSGVVNATESALIAGEKFFYSALLAFVGRLIFVGVGFAALTAGRSVVVVMAGLLAGIFIESILRLLLVASRVARFSFRFPLGKLREMFVASLPFALAAVAGVIYSQTGVVALEILKGDADVGVFNLAYSLFIPYIWATVILARVTLPGITQLFRTDEDAARMNSWQWYRMLAMAGVPAAVAVSLLAKPVLAFFPEGYSQSAMVLVILVWSLPLALVSAIELNILQIIGREKAAARSLMIATAVTVALDFTLIPFMGVNGAAIATLGGAVVREGLVFLEVKKHFLQLNYIKLFVKPSAGAAVMLLVALIAWSLGPWLATMLGLTAYGAALLATGALRVSELKSLARS